MRTSGLSPACAVAASEIFRSARIVSAFVAAELARLYRKAERGQIPTADASRLAYMLTSLGKVIEAAQQAKAQSLIHGTITEILPPSLADFYAQMNRGNG